MTRITLIALLALSGCSLGNVEKDFLCAAEDGLPCRSIKDVDGVSATDGTTVAEAEADTRNKSITGAPIFGGKKTGAGAAAVVPAGGVAYPSARYRIPEKTARLWIAPYRDGNEILHEGTYVHFVIREAAWGQR